MSPSLPAALAIALLAIPGAALAAEPDPAGRLLFESRLRHETVDQETAPLDATALTLRARLGWESPKLAELRLLAEAEAVAVLIDDYADPAHPDPRYPAIPDPEGVELNRLQLTWTGLPDTEVVVGRQRLNLANQRFIGAVGWRQNEQTFDAARVTTTALEPVTLTYAYANRVQRPLGGEHPQGVWRGDIHAALAEAATPAGRLTGYGYLIDLDEAPTQSSATWGVRLAGDRPVGGGLKASWELEYARQSGHGANPQDDVLDYRLASAGLAGERWSASLVYERLEGDGLAAFQTPLATGHGFQGWSDVIGATPAVGVRDLYLRGEATASLFGRPLRLRAEAHDFASSDGELDLGRELDLAAALPLNRAWTLEIKAAAFDGRLTGFPDTVRTWMTLEYRF